MATKRVPATIDEIADIIESYFSYPINDYLAKVFLRSFFDEFNSEVEKQDCKLFIQLLSEVQHRGIDCSNEELLQAVELVRQRGKFPTDWPCTHEELKQEAKIINRQHKNEESSTTEPTE